MDDATCSNDLTRFRNQAIRYWERRRIIYLLLLIPPTVVGYMASQLFPQLIKKSSYADYELIAMLGAAFIGANIVYCFAYVIEFLTIGTKFRESYENQGRTILFIAGYLLGILLAASSAYTMATGKSPI